MIVNVEFFDENPIENVITSLNYKVDKTIFFGYKEMLDEKKNSVDRFLKRICGVKEVEFYEVNRTDLMHVIESMSFVMKKEQEQGHQLFFDLTGGEDLLLVAFGILSRELKASMHLYEIISNTMYEYAYEDSVLLSQAAECDPITLDLDGFISLYGGIINYRMHKSFKDLWDQEQLKDIESMWQLSREYDTRWVYYAGLFRKFQPDSYLQVQVSEKTFLAEVRKVQKIGSPEEFIRFLGDCEKAGFLNDVAYKNGYLRFTYKNEDIQNYFWDGGSILEMYAFLIESQNENANDCRVGVHIDWDGVINQPSGKDVINEIDIMSMRNNLPTFISCKIGNVDQMALYELDTVANRFGGKYARKVLAVAKEVAPGHLQRAKEMGIEVKNVAKEKN